MQNDFSFFFTGLEDRELALAVLDARRMREGEEGFRSEHIAQMASDLNRVFPGLTLSKCKALVVDQVEKEAAQRWANDMLARNQDHKLN